MRWSMRPFSSGLELQAKTSNSKCLIWQFPELKNIYTATINLRLDRALRISKFERTTLPIPWWDVDNSRAGFRHEERFSILPIMFEYPVDAPTKEAWIFVSHCSQYFQRAQMITGLFRFEEVEVVTERIDGLVTGNDAKSMSRKLMTLTWSRCPPHTVSGGVAFGVLQSACGGTFVSSFLSSISRLRSFARRR